MLKFFSLVACILGSWILLVLFFMLVALITSIFIALGSTILEIVRELIEQAVAEHRARKRIERMK